MKVGVVGAGLIGGSLIKRWSEAAPVLVFDKASTISHSNVTNASLEEMARECDITWVATLPQEAPGVITNILRSGKGLVADVASTKEGILEQIPARYRSRYIGTHPMAGSEKRGWENSSADLLQGCTWAITSKPAVPDLLTASDLINQFKANIVFCSAKEHDQAVATSSHAVQLLQTLIAANLNSDLEKIISGPALRDSTRLAEGSHSPLWKEIIQSNRENVQRRLALLQKGLKEIDLDDLRPLWEKGRQERLRLLDLRWKEPSWRSVSVQAEDFWQEVAEKYWHLRIKEIKQRVNGEVCFKVASD